MNIVSEAATRLGDRIFGSGCEDGIVQIDTRPGIPLCQYEKGACMVSVFGGCSAEFVTFDPVRATTRISFLQGSTLDKVMQRIAACAVINAVTGFLCLSRRLHACAPQHHPRCAAALAERCRGLRVFCVGVLFRQDALGNLSFVEDPDSADLFLVTGEGLVSPEGTDLVTRYRGEKPLLFVAPSTAGICSILDMEHWCPFGGTDFAGVGGD